MNSTYVQLKKNLEYLKLNQMDLHLDEVIDQPVIVDGKE